MSTIENSPSNNGRGSDAWARSWMHLRVDRCSPGYCRVSFDHPPINAISAITVAELAELVDLIEQDVDLNVVVFDSANRDFFLTHSGTEDAPDSTRLPTRAAGLPAWSDLLVRLARAPVLSIAVIRGRAEGAGTEFTLACDLRFASRENTRLGQFEVGRTGGDPSRGPLSSLPRLTGRGRALEILLVADDLDGPRAEQYGYVNRVIADDRLDDEVDAIASRVARLEHHAVARTKSYVDRVTLAR